MPKILALELEARMIDEIKSLWSKFKTMIVYSLFLFIIGGGLGFYISEKTRPVVHDPIIQPDVTPPKHTEVNKPTTPAENLARDQAKITVDRTLEKDIYHIKAYNYWDQVDIHDKIIIPVSTPRFMVQADLYGLMVDKKPSYMYGASLNYFYNSRIYVGGGFAGSSYGAAVHANIGLTFY